MKALIITPSGEHPLDGGYMTGLRRKIDDLDRALAGGFLRKLGVAMVDDVCLRIRQQRTPDGRRQQANSPSTFLWKQHRGVRPNIPLNDTGVLMNASNYRVNLARQGRSVEVSLPASRVRVADDLAARGYYFFGFPPAARVEAITDAVLDSLSASDYFRLLDLFSVR
jgi:hypothetical protein